MGDTIYSDTEVPGYTLADVALDQKQKWAAYKTNLGQKRWTKARGSAAYYAHWDDHEFINDFSREESSFPLAVGDVNIDGEKLYKDGVKAFRDYNPVGYKKQTGHLPLGPLGQEPRDLLPRRALVPQRERRLRRRTATTRPAAATPTSRRPPRRAPATLLGHRPAARQPAAAGLRRGDQRSEPDDARLAPAAEVRAGDQELERDLQGDLQRGPDPAVLRAPV